MQFSFWLSIILKFNGWLNDFFIKENQKLLKNLQNIEGLV